MSMNLSNIKLINLIPPNLQTNPDIISACESADQSLSAFVAQSNKILLYPNIDNITDEDLIDYLAIEEHTDYYNQELSLIKKKLVVKDSINIHKKKGTKSAVEDLAISVFDFAVVSEWFEYSGSPYNFKIEVAYSDELSDSITEFRALINQVKNVRSVLELITVRFEPNVNIEENVYATLIARNTKLGVWTLGNTPFATPGSEVQIQ